MRSSPGAIGYVEYIFANANRIGMMQLQNAAGRFVVPSPASFEAAAAQANWRASLTPTMVNLGGPNTWPIVSASYILVPRNPRDPARAAQVLRFFDWAFTKGGPTAQQLSYIPLPQPVTKLVRANWSQVRGPDGRPVFAGR